MSDKKPNMKSLKPALKYPAGGKRSEDKGKKKEVAFDSSANGPAATKPQAETRNEALKSDKEKKKKVTFDLSANGSPAETPREKRNEGKKATKNEVRSDHLSASGSSGSASKAQTEERNKVDEDSKKAQVGRSIPTLLWKKRLNCHDLHTRNLRVPAGIFLSKRHRGGEHEGMIVVPFMDNKGELWHMQASYEGLSMNWDKFVKEHGLRNKDVILFYDDGPNSEYFMIDYIRIDD